MVSAALLYWLAPVNRIAGFVDYFQGWRWCLSLVLVNIACSQRCFRDNFTVCPLGEHACFPIQVAVVAERQERLANSLIQTT